MRKKTAQATPNHLLRRARMERGWTQRLVAERIGASNDIIVTRWERGTAFPSPHYVERLCQLFGQPASELGLLRDLYTLAASQVPPRSYPRPVPPGAPMPPPSQQNVSLLSALPLVGREADLDVLEALYRDVLRGQMQVALLQGEAGIGKTRLASAFLARAAREGATPLQGRAFEMGGRLPYQLLAHALSRRLEEEQAPEALLGATWLSELSRILPELRERYPSLPEVSGDDLTGRIRLFEAVTRLLQAFCERGPVVLCIDDVHWADAASLDVLHYAGQRWHESGTPLLLLLSMRSGALAPTSFLSQWLSSLHHDLPVTDLTLAPLSLSEMLHLLGALISQQNMTSSQQDLLIDFGQWLFQETRGHPFYLVETLKDLMKRQILTFHPASEGEKLELDTGRLRAVQSQGMLPPGVRWLILAHLERLTKEGRALLMASTVLGQEASFDLLCRIAEVSERDAPVALEEVLRQGLLREGCSERGGELRYLFGHDKIREVTAAEMNEAEYRLLHRRAFAELSRASRSPAELAHHALAAGLAEQVVGLSLAAGDEAARFFAYTIASQHYTQALEALSQLPETTVTRRTRVETTIKLVRVSWATADTEQTLQLLAEAEELAQVLNDQSWLASIHYWIGMVYGNRYGTRQAREWAEKALEEAKELDDEELMALASLQLGRVLSLQGHFDSAEELLTPIISVLERTANWEAWTDALGYLGIVQAARGRCAEGKASGQRAVEHVRHSGEVKSYQALRARHFRSIIFLYSNDLLHMLEESDWVVQEAEKIADWLLVYWAYGLRSWAQSRLGEHEAALQSMARAREAASRSGGHMICQDILEAVNAELLLATGHVEEALTCAQNTIKLAREEVGGLLSEGIAERVQGQALAQLTRWEEAQIHLEASVQTLFSGKSLLEAARTHVAWGLLCRDHGERGSTRTHFERASVQFEASGLTRECQALNEYLAHLCKG